MNIIKMRDVKMLFNEKVVLSNINLAISQDEIFGLSTPPARRPPLSFPQVVRFTYRYRTVKLT